MIKDANNDNLLSQNIDSNFYLFYQVWKELTDKRTMDSYQYRIMNSLSALDELNNVIGKRLSGAYATNHNVDECRLEMATIAKNDAVIEKHYPAIWKSMMHHLHKKAETDAELKALRYNVVFFYNTLSTSYFQHLVDEVENDIQQSNTSGIIKKTNQLISCCAFRGWSTAALYRLINVLNGQNDWENKWELFKSSLLKPDETSFKVYIQIDLKYKYIDRIPMEEKTHQEMADLGVSVFTRAQMLEETPVLSSKNLPDKKYMMVAVEAFDCYSACYKAVDRCSNVLSVLSFYNYVEPWSCQNLSCWVIDQVNDDAENLLSKHLNLSFDYLDSSQKIFRATKKLFQAGDIPINKKLQASYIYSSMGKAAGSQEERFMNTWVALESLCRSDVFENIISNVLEIVPPALCTRYIYRHFRNFIEDCFRCDVELTFSTGDYNFKDSRDRIEHVADIIRVINDSVLYLELENKCNVNSLLLYRCKDLHTLATDKSVMIQRIKNHYSTVRKQLSRLYRIRNDIAHTGMTSSASLIPYVEHLEDYLSDFIAEVVMCANNKHEEKTEIVFEIIKNNYTLFNDITNSKSPTVCEEILNELLLSGIINCFKDED